MPSPLYILLHIYKTAGLTLEANIQLNLDRSQAVPMYVGPMGLDLAKRVGNPGNPGWVTERVMAYVTERVRKQTMLAYGHMAFYGLHQCVAHPVEPRYVVFLRDPVERVISLYYYLRYKSENHWHHELANAGWDLAAWLENSQALWHHNGQVRQLLIGSDDNAAGSRELSPSHLATAKQRLRDFWYIGLTEKFAADAFYLYGTFDFRRFHTEARVNVTPRKPAISGALRQLIAHYSALDIELYDFARRLRAERLAAQPLRYVGRRSLARLRRQLDHWRQRRQRATQAPTSGN